MRASSGFTMVRNELVDLAMPYLNSKHQGAAIGIALFIERWTTGYKRQVSMTMSVRQLAHGIGYCLSATQAGVEFLLALHMIAVETIGRGRGAQTSWRLTPASTWITPENNDRPTGTLKGARKNVPLTGTLNGVNDRPTGTLSAKNVPVEATSTSNKEIHINKQRKEIPAHAVTTPKSKPPKERKTTPAEQDYIRRVFEAVSPHRPGHGGAMRGAEVKGILRMYRLDARPTPEQLATFYSVEMTKPYYDSHALYIHQLEGNLAVYRRNPRAYREGIERSRKGAKGDYDHKTPPHGRNDVTPVFTRPSLD